METLQQLHAKIVKENIGTILSAVKEKASSDNAFNPVSIYFLMNFTANPIDPFLKLYLYESNLRPDIKFGNFDNVQQEILDETSPLYQQKFDIIVCALFYSPTDANFLNRLLDTKNLIEELKILFDLIQVKTKSLILLNTFLLPFYLPGSYTDAILEINQFIRQYIREHANRFFLMDWNRYTQILGEENSIDYRYAYMYKAPFKKNFLSYYANDITKVARALYGHAKKCLILDCDNTLWGGIIGEDGLANIKLDNHEHPGKIFYDFQHSVLELAKRGVIIALCSKNNEEDVWEVIDKHPHCLLKRNHIATYRINWSNKADNIREMVKELNIGLDSCVFVDDSQTECELVKLAIPEITVLNVPNPGYEYPSLLFKEGLFETLTVNATDEVRNLQYQQEHQRKEIQKNYQNIEDYLACLELIADIHPMKQNEIPRVAQLTQKTNQFNLTTHRYTQQQIEDFHRSDTSAVFTLSVKDKFGDYGLTGVMIVLQKGDKGFIDSYLMSCRILSRNLEYIFLEHVLNKLSKQWNITTWEAEYKPTAKNSQIGDFLKKAGFNANENNYFNLSTQDWSGYQMNYLKIETEVE